MDTVPASVPGTGQRERGGVRHVVRISDEERCIHKAVVSVGV